MLSQLLKLINAFKRLFVTTEECDICFDAEPVVTINDDLYCDDCFRAIFSLCRVCGANYRPVAFVDGIHCRD